jgi:hypothetical protein
MFKYHIRYQPHRMACIYMLLNTNEIQLSIFSLNRLFIFEMKTKLRIELSIVLN